MKYFKVNPGGNITAIVKGEFNKSRRIKIARAILQSDKKVEQVGFWQAPRLKKSAARLQMMGGEFCGNASRSLAYLIFRESGIKKMQLECSGFPKPLLCEIYAKGKALTCAITINSNVFKLKKIAGYDLVIMPGIVYLIIHGKINKNKAKQILASLGLLKKPAVGIISIQKKSAKLVVSGKSKKSAEFSIKAFVWVKATKTFYEETACASGTIAAAFCIRKLQSKNNQFRSKNKFFITQPSRSVFSVNFKGRLCILNGPILF
jgi:diaminopimelate epimerase